MYRSLSYGAGNTIWYHHGLLSLLVGGFALLSIRFLGQCCIKSHLWRSRACMLTYRWVCLNSDAAPSLLVFTKPRCGFRSIAVAYNYMHCDAHTVN